MKVSTICCAVMALCLCSCTGTSSTKQLAMNWDYMDYEMSSAAVNTAPANLLNTATE